MKKKANYHYEWFAYTDNLNYGRQLIGRFKSLAVACYEAKSAGKGVFVLEKHRVKNKQS